MRRSSVGKSNSGTRSVHRKGKVRAIQRTALTIVLIPTFVDCNFAFVIPNRQSGGRKSIDAIAIYILQPRTQTIGLPVTRAPQLRLETAYCGSDDRGNAGCDPMGFVIVIELDSSICSQRDWNVIVIPPVTLSPTIIERSLRLLTPRWDVERSLPDIIISII